MRNFGTTPLALLSDVSLGVTRRIASSRGALQHLVVGCGYVILAVAVLGANPFHGQTVAPLDLLVAHPGWKSVVPTVHVTHPARSDILDARIPAWEFYKQRFWGDGSLLWNPTRSGGVPGVQNLANGTFTPAFLAFLLIKNDGLGYYIGDLLNLVIAGMGLFLFLRPFITASGAFVGGSIFMLSGFNAAWFFWPHVATAIWIPWLLWTGSRWLLQRDYRWLIGISLSGALLIGGGFPSVAAYGFYLFSFWTVVVTISQWKREKSSAIIAAALSFAAVALSFIIMALPLFSLAQYLGRIDLSYRHGGTALSSATYLYSFINPYFIGRPRVETTGYVGVVALAFAVIALAMMAFSRRSDERRLTIFAAISFVISLAVAFGWVNYDFIRLIPGVGGSLWSRLLVIVDLSLAILAGIGISQLLRLASRAGSWRIALVIMIACLVIYQLYDQKRLFNRFNAVVSSQWWYPDTPTLDYVKSHLGPMQSIIADSSYLVAGTLTEYGLRDWYAHGFKTKREKVPLEKMVNNPFRTATAAVFNGYKIQLRSPLMDLFDVKYVLVGAKSLPRLTSHLVLAQKRVTHSPAPPLPAHSLTQKIELQKALNISVVSLPLATYHAPHAPADVELTLRNSAGNVLGRASVSKGKITDNSEQYFYFKPAIALKKGDYTLSLTLAETTGHGRLTVWTTRNTTPGDRLVVDGKVTDKSMLFKLWDGTRQVPPGWSKHKLEPAVVALENKEVPNGAYIVASLEGIATQVQSVPTRDVGDTKVVANVGPSSKGYLVFPMRSYPGWQMYADGKPIPMEKYLGVFPAAKLDGAQENITIKYVPVELFYAAAVSFFGIIIAVGIPCMLDARRRKSSV